MATETQRAQQVRVGSPDSSVDDPTTKEAAEQDAKLAERLAHMINETVDRLSPMLKMIRKVCTISALLCACS